MTQANTWRFRCVDQLSNYAARSTKQSVRIGSRFPQLALKYPTSSSARQEIECAFPPVSHALDARAWLSHECFEWTRKGHTSLMGDSVSGTKYCFHSRFAAEP